MLVETEYYEWRLDKCHRWNEIDWHGMSWNKRNDLKGNKKGRGARLTKMEHVWLCFFGLFLFKNPSDMKVKHTQRVRLTSSRSNLHRPRKTSSPRSLIRMRFVTPMTLLYCFANSAHSPFFRSLFSKIQSPASEFLYNIITQVTL